MTQTSTSTHPTINFDHARKCKHLLEECVVCQRNVKVAASLPLPILTATLENPQTHTFKTSLAAVAVENLMSRTIHNVRGGKQKGRAMLDVAASMFYLKGYEGRGGSL